MNGFTLAFEADALCAVERLEPGWDVAISFDTCSRLRQEELADTVAPERSYGRSHELAAHASLAQLGIGIAEESILAVLAGEGDRLVQLLAS